MKNNIKKILFLFIITTFSTVSYSQDYIILKNGQEIEAKIIKQNEQIVQYRILNDLSGETKTISKEQILLIKYHDGTTIVISNIKKDSTQVITEIETNTKIYNHTELKEIAIKDAKENYHPFIYSASSCCMITACSPVGIPIAAWMAFTSPKVKDLNISEEYINNGVYCTYYTEEAHRMKRKNIIIGSTIGILINTAALILFFTI